MKGGLRRIFHWFYSRSTCALSTEWGVDGISIFVTFLLRILTLKSVVRDVIKSQKGLVGIFDDQILSILLAPYEIQDTPDDAPGVVHGEINLTGELDGFELLHANDDMPAAVLDVKPGHKSKLEVVSSSQDTLGGPFSKFASIALQLICKNSSLLAL